MSKINSADEKYNIHNQRNEIKYVTNNVQELKEDKWRQRANHREEWSSLVKRPQFSENCMAYD
jgi:hypothetical protein